MQQWALDEFALMGGNTWVLAQPEPTQFATPADCLAAFKVTDRTASILTDECPDFPELCARGGLVARSVLRGDDPSSLKLEAWWNRAA